MKNMIITNVKNSLKSDDIKQEIEKGISPMPYKFKFNFSQNWLAPLVPQDITQEFIDNIRLDVDNSYDELEAIHSKIDIKSTQGYNDLVKVCHIVKEIRTYTIRLALEERRMNENEEDKATYYTSEDLYCAIKRKV